MTQIPFEKLIDLAEGRLSDEESAQLHQQLASADVETVSNWRWIQGFARLSTSIDLPAPPRQVREQVLAALRQKTQPPSLLQRLVATLTFDSWQPGHLTPAAARSAALDQPRQLLFTAGEIDVSLELDGEVITGQILGSDLNWYTVTLQQGGQQRAITTSSPLGEFSFTAVPAGQYTVRLTGAEHSVQLAPIDL